MTVSIIIAIYNRTRYLAGLLSRIRASYPDVEILVVDDGSDEKHAEVIRQLSLKFYTKLISHEVNAGLSASRNSAINEAKGNLLVFLDDDIVPIGNWLEIFTERAEQGYSVICGTILPLFENGRPHFYNDSLEFILGLNSSEKALLEGATAMKVEIFKEVGLFDSELGRRKRNGMSGEGWQLFKQAIEKGYTTDVAMEAIFYHHVPKEKQSFSYFLKRAWAEGLSDKRAMTESSKFPFLALRSIQSFIWFFSNAIIAVVYAAGRARRRK